MKRLLTLTVTLLLIALLLIPLCATASAEEPLVIDLAGLVTKEQAQALQQAAKELSDRRGVKVVILTTQTTGRRDAEAFADDYYDEHFALVGEPDGILLLISMEERDLYISTCGTMIDMVDEDMVDVILDEIFDDVRNGDYNAAFSKYLKKVDQVIESYPQRLEEQQRREEAARQQAKEARQRRLRRSFVIAPIIGLVVGFLPLLINQSSLTTVRPHDDAGDYFRDQDRRMTVTRDIFLYTNRSTRVIEPQRSSGGSSHSSHSTHTSSSGVTHGGHGRKF